MAPRSTSPTPTATSLNSRGHPKKPNSDGAARPGRLRRSGSVLDRILLSNDDGIEAPGLTVLEEIARELAREIWVVAPEHDQSGVSHAVSLHHPIRVTSGVRDATRLPGRRATAR